MNDTKKRAEKKNNFTRKLPETPVDVKPEFSTDHLYKDTNFLQPQRGESTSLIDTHAHLTFPDFKEDLDKVIERARSAGIEFIITIGSGAGLENTQEAVQLANRYPSIYASVGVHPHDARNLSDEAVDKIKILSREKKTVAVGEIGLDYNKMHSSKEDQLECFERMLHIAFEAHLPVIIHDRDAHKDCLYTLRKNYGSSLGGVFHCFGGDTDIAQQVLDMGFFISVSGIVTFGKNIDQLVQVVRYVPIERLVLETDAPFLAPVPYRGKRNEPSYIPYIAKAIADIKGLSIADVARITTINAKRLFRLPGMIPEAKIAYVIRNSLYLNITNRCNLACKFCPKRSQDFEVKGYNLKLEREPDVEDVFKAMGDPTGFEEVVFCGFGEPTVRFELLKEIARELKERNVRVRLNTDGLANLMHGRNVLPELRGLIDEVSVSMNAPDAATYARICPSKWGEKAYYALKDFIKEAKVHIPIVSVTAVTYEGVDIEGCRRVAEEELGVKFRVREYKEVG